MTPKYVKIFFWLLVSLSVLFFLWVVGSLVKLLLISALLAYILDPVATAMESKGMSRLGATGIIFLAIGIVLTIFVFIIVPGLVHEVQNLQNSGNGRETGQLVVQLQNLLAPKFALFGVDHLDLVQRIAEAKKHLSDAVLGYLLSDAVTLITHLVAIPFIIFFLLKDGRQLKRQFMRVIPNKYFEFTLSLLYKMDLQLGLYLRGQFLDAVLFGLLSTAALWFLDVRYFTFIGVFAGMANLIPYVGPIAGAALATGVTVLTTGNPIRIGYVILAFVVVKLLDDAVIQPVVVARSVDMHPLLVLFVVIIGGQFFGILGMLLSVPAAGFLKVVIGESIHMIRRYQIS